MYGIDIYLTGNAAREGHRICEVPLGRKIHNPGFPKIVKISQQVIDALWHICLPVRRGTPVGRAAPAGEVHGR